MAPVRVQVQAFLHQLHPQNQQKPAKVPKKQVEAYVAELHSRGMGYETIAQCIGYRKSGVQKIVQRIEARKDGDGSAPAPAKNKTIGTLKRTRTMLQKLSKSLGLTDESDKELFRSIDEFLKTHEELLQEGLAKENPPAQDVSEESTYQ